MDDSDDNERGSPKIALALARAASAKGLKPLTPRVLEEIEELLGMLAVKLGHAPGCKLMICTCGLWENRKAATRSDL